MKNARNNTNSNDKSFQFEKVKKIFNMLLFSTLVIFSVETVLMVVLEFILDIPEPIVWYVDGLILVILLFPINYIFIVQPMLRQIDEHRKTNQELVKSNELLERFFDISDILIAYMDDKFNFLRVNYAYAKTDKLKPEDFIGKNHFELFPNEENRQIFQTVVDSGKAFYILDKPFENNFDSENNTRYWDWSLLPTKDINGKVVGLILVAADRTTQRQTQMALAESERRFRAIFNQTFQNIELLDANGNVLLVNQTTLDFTGVDSETIYGKPYWEMPWWDQTSEELASLKNAIRQALQGKTVRGTHPIHTSNNEIAIMDKTIKPMFDDAGNPIMLICEGRDITERIKNEKMLEQNKVEINRLYQAEIRAHILAQTMRRAALALSASLNSDTVLDTLLDFLQELVCFTSAHMELLQDEDHLLVRLARGEENWPEEKRLLGKTLEISELKIFDPIFLNKEFVECQDTNFYEGSRYYPGNQFIGSWIAIPLLAGDKIIGLCILEHTQTNFFTPELIKWATSLTHQAAVAIQNAWLFEQVRDGREHLQALSRRLVEVQESERLYIARELHDEAGQALTSLLLGLRNLEQCGGDREAVIVHSQELRRITDGVMEDLHRLAVDLRPASLDHLGLVPALHQHSELISQKHNLSIQLEVVGQMDRFTDEMETVIYRIVQEALTNVVRHSQATQVDIILERRDSTLVVIVEDNGIGIENIDQTRNHLGMVGMRERAEMLGGTITVEGSKGNGTTIILEVPCLFEL